MIQLVIYGIFAFLTGWFTRILSEIWSERNRKTRGDEARCEPREANHPSIS